MTDTPKKKPRRKVDKPIPTGAFANQQLSLFQEFLANTTDEKNELANAVDLWDNVPRFSISRKRQEELRLAGGFLPISTIDFKYRGHEMKVHIRPARLELRGKDGKPTGETVEYYPGAREELIEHALRKIAVDQQAGFFDKSDFRSGCRFTLYQLRTHLASQGHSLRYDELIDGLDILSLSTIEIEGGSDQEDVTYTRMNYLSLLARVRKKDIVADPDAKWLVQFHPLITDSIQKITYRQFNYKRLMNCRTQLARWLISQLVLKYTQAALTNSFEMRYSTIKRDSALLGGYKQERQGVAALDDAWAEIKALGVLTNFKKSEQRGSRAKLEDVIYTLYPSPEFTAEQKAANRRQFDAQIKNSPLPQQALTAHMEPDKTSRMVSMLVDKTDREQKKRGE
ncbi:MAG: replication protein [Lentisphaerota bacterium]